MTLEQPRSWSQFPMCVEPRKPSVGHELTVHSSSAADQMMRKIQPDQDVDRDDDLQLLRPASICVPPSRPFRYSIVVLSVSAGRPCSISPRWLHPPPLHFMAVFLPTYMHHHPPPPAPRPPRPSVPGSQLDRTHTGL
ncbi:unnamed protein product [Pleuronectes platessa]|uniref:Uncharacterized protein n=1 Tax=Pleuronectes platessa TaxID=8262 RepID=A0A9N7UU20_PLEPL|nr:unnamed protein product [Pleuronectes platessa]